MTAIGRRQRQQPSPQQQQSLSRKLPTQASDIPPSQISCSSRLSDNLLQRKEGRNIEIAHFFRARYSFCVRVRVCFQHTARARVLERKVGWSFAFKCTMLIAFRASKEDDLRAAAAIRAARRGRWTAAAASSSRRS